ncbi:MAG: hypothetical protein ACSLE5_11685 [Porticoccaceae bacterium]
MAPKNKGSSEPGSEEPKRISISLKVGESEYIRAADWRDGRLILTLTAVSVDEEFRTRLIEMLGPDYGEMALAKVHDLSVLRILQLALEER